MKKNVVFVALFCLTFSLFAQSKLGLKFSPSISSNRVSLVDSLYDVEPHNNAFKFSLGLVYDHQITDTYFFSTGLIFVPKQVSLNVTEEADQPSANYTKEPIEEYKLNYLQIPVTLKLYTNEIQPDTKVFFQVGLAPEFKVFSEPVEEEYDLIEEFKGVDFSILFGGGVEYRAGINTTLYGSVTYQRGLANVIKTETWGFQEELFIRNSLVSFDLGIKF